VSLCFHKPCRNLLVVPDALPQERSHNTGAEAVRLGLSAALSAASAMLTKRR